jgi:hypothetical protein
VAALLFAPAFIDRIGGRRSFAGWVLMGGVLLVVAVALQRAARSQARHSAVKAEEPRTRPVAVRLVPMRDDLASEQLAATDGPGNVGA